MAKSDFYFPLYYKQLLSSTIGWKDDEFGCYLKLLIHQFDNGSIPKDLNELARIAPSVKKHWDKLLSKKFTENSEGRLQNKVMAEIYEDIQLKKKKNSENGKKGGRGKRTVNQNESERKANGFEIETQNEAKIILNNKELIVKERESTPTHSDYWDKEAERKRPLTECMMLSLKHDTWVEKNGVTESQLEKFNDFLISQGEEQKTILDYKKHFANKKRLSPDLFTDVQNQTPTKRKMIM